MRKPIKSTTFCFFAPGPCCIFTTSSLAWDLYPYCTLVTLVACCSCWRSAPVPRQLSVQDRSRFPTAASQHNSMPQQLRQRQGITRTRLRNVSRRAAALLAALLLLVPTCQARIQRLESITWHPPAQAAAAASTASGQHTYHEVKLASSLRMLRRHPAVHTLQVGHVGDVGDVGLGGQWVNL